LVGDTGVGKTHILSRYIKGTLPKNKFPTIGVEFATKPVPLKTGGTVKAQIWDTGIYMKVFILNYSWPRTFQSNHKRVFIIFKILYFYEYSHYRKSLGALIVYDITKEQSFLSVKKWMEEVKEHAEPDIVIMLVGNKLDACEKNPLERKVSAERAMEFAK
jgi:Rab family protein